MPPVAENVHLLANFLTLSAPTVTRSPRRKQVFLSFRGPRASVGFRASEDWLDFLVVCGAAQSGLLRR